MKYCHHLLISNLYEFLWGHGFLKNVNRPLMSLHYKRWCSFSVLLSCFPVQLSKYWMNEWCIYIVLYCLLLYTQSALQSRGGGFSSTTTSVENPLGWCDGCHRTTAPVRSPHTSYRWRGERDIEPIKCMRSPHTSYRRRGERVIEPIKCMHSPHTSYRWRGESHRANQSSVCAQHTPATGGEERAIGPIKCMRSPHTSYRWRGERVIETIKCMRSPHTSYRWRGERVIETIKCMLSPHTSYRWRGERVIETIKCMRSPHTSYRWRGDSHRANQVYGDN